MPVITAIARRRDKGAHDPCERRRLLIFLGGRRSCRDVSRNKLLLRARVVFQWWIDHNNRGTRTWPPRRKISCFRDRGSRTRRDELNFNLVLLYPRRATRGDLRTELSVSFGMWRIYTRWSRVDPFTSRLMSRTEIMRRCSVIFSLRLNTITRRER